MPEPAPSLLDQIAALNAQASLNPHTLETLLGVMVQPDEARSNAYYTFYVGHPRKPGEIALADLRVPKERAQPGGEFVFLELSKQCALRRADLVRKFGEPSSLAVPTPENQSTYALRYLYRLDGHSVSFALASTPSDKVVSVSLDRTR